LVEKPATAPFNTNNHKPKGEFLMKKYLPFFLILSFYLIPVASYASLEGAMYSLRSQMSTVFLPALSLIGIILAAISLAMGHHNAKNHITMAVIGAMVGFGADGIIDFIRRTFGG
jgi:phosphoglycerol transferase MdoB-like AlkP superfamily enzyme